MISAVKQIVQLLEGVHALWAIVGSCNLYLRNCKSTPHDIDIITSCEGATAIYARLEKFAVMPPSHSGAGNVRSYFFRAVVAGVTVEVMGAPENLVDGQWKKNLMWLDNVERIRLHDCAIPLTTLAYEKCINQQLGNWSRVQEIEVCLASRISRMEGSGR